MALSEFDYRFKQRQERVEKPTQRDNADVKLVVVHYTEKPLASSKAVVEELFGPGLL